MCIMNKAIKARKGFGYSFDVRKRDGAVASWGAVEEIINRNPETTWPPQSRNAFNQSNYSNDSLHADSD